MDLFTYYQALEQRRKKANQELASERQQQTILEIKKKFCENAILNGISFTENATGREHNSQVGGNKV